MPQSKINKNQLYRAINTVFNKGFYLYVDNHDYGMYKAKIDKISDDHSEYESSELTLVPTGGRHQEFYIDLLTIKSAIFDMDPDNYKLLITNKYNKEYLLLAHKRPKDVTSKPSVLKEAFKKFLDNTKIKRIITYV